MYVVFTYALFLWNKLAYFFYQYLIPRPGPGLRLLSNFSTAFKGGGVIKSHHTTIVRVRGAQESGSLEWLVTRRGGSQEGVMGSEGKGGNWRQGHGSGLSQGEMGNKRG